MAVPHTQATTIEAPNEFPSMHITARRRWLALDLEELWAYRELLYFFVWRDIKVRYKQTVIGAAWAILQPVMTMLVFSLFFGRLARIPSQGLPYPVFYYCALLPWMYFSTATNIVALFCRLSGVIGVSGFCHLVQRRLSGRLAGRSLDQGGMRRSPPFT
jgi:hypothetical protein